VFDLLTPVFFAEEVLAFESKIVGLQAVFGGQLTLKLFDQPFLVNIEPVSDEFF
jgi:hypothetical protein